MKKIYKFLGYIIAFSYYIITKSSTFALEFRDFNNGAHGGDREPPTPLINISLNPVLFTLVKFIIIPILILYFIYNSIIFPYRFYKSYKIKTSEEKKNMFPVLIIHNYIIKGIIIILILIISLYLISEELAVNTFLSLKNIVFYLLYYYLIINIGVGLYIIFKKRNKIIGKNIIIDNILFVIIVSIFMLFFNYILLHYC